jgi:hypothetical protein
MPTSTTIGPNGTVLAVVDEDTKVDLRRYLGYPAYGYGTTGFWEMGFFLWQYGQLELRMNSLTVSEFDRVTYLLTNIQQIEDDLFGMRTAMIVDEAAVFHRNMDEPADRHTEYAWWLRHLLTFMGVKPGPNFEGGRIHNSARARL